MIYCAIFPSEAAVRNGFVNVYIEEDEYFLGSVHALRDDADELLQSTRGPDQKAYRINVKVKS